MQSMVLIQHAHSCRYSFTLAWLQFSYILWYIYQLYNFIKRYVQKKNPIYSASKQIYLNLPCECHSELAPSLLTKHWTHNPPFGVGISCHFETALVLESWTVGCGWFADKELTQQGTHNPPYYFQIYDKEGILATLGLRFAKEWLLKPLGNSRKKVTLMRI